MATGVCHTDAYTLDGKRLWRINLGRNIRAGAHYTHFLAYDFDGDGKSEHPGYAGNYYINASNEMRPGVFGPNREPLVVGELAELRDLVGREAHGNDPDPHPRGSAVAPSVETIRLGRKPA